MWNLKNQLNITILPANNWNVMVVMEWTKHNREIEEMELPITIDRTRSTLIPHYSNSPHLYWLGKIYKLLLFTSISTSQAPMYLLKKRSTWLKGKMVRRRHWTWKDIRSQESSDGLLSFCLFNSYLQMQNKFYSQKDDLSIASLL